MSYEDAGSGELPDVNDRERPAELPCYEVDGFGHYRHDPRRPHHVIRDWPTIWAVAVIDDVSRKYYLHDGPELGIGAETRSKLAELSGHVFASAAATRKP